jgi:hypothetical protein
MKTQLTPILTVVLGILANSGLAAKPGLRREATEWTNVWVAEATRTDLPRVLLIGDSICNGYHLGVAQELKGKTLVAMLATSSAIGDPTLTEQVRLLLTNYKFAAIHFNVGLHGWAYSEEEYRREFPKLLEVIRRSAPGAKLIWATSTPMRKTAPNLGEFRPDNQRVKARNKIVVDLAARERIPVDDLYSLVESHPEYWADDGVHYRPEGRAVQARQVAKTILDLLGK